LTFPKQATAKASDPCDRRPDETASAYARFCLYQFLPAYSRSLSAVARVCGVTRQSIQQQATRHEWELRVGPPNYLAALTALSYGGKHPLLELLEERERDLQKQEVTDPDTGFDLAFLEALEKEDHFAGLDLEVDHLEGFDFEIDPLADLDLTP
jgi:hypothetical protein